MGFGTKAKAMMIGFICAATMTSCTINLSDLKNPVPPEQVNSIAETIDNTDLTDENSVAELAVELNDWGELIDGKFQSAHLERVVDGDTIVVDIDGMDYKVRLIGVNTPESVATEEYLEKTGKKNTAEGKQASEYTKDVLKDTDTVYLEMDTSDKDKYDRLLRYVWLELPDDEFDTYEVSEKMLNAMLIKDDMAEVEIYHPDDMYEKQFKEIAERE